MSSLRISRTSCWPWPSRRSSPSPRPGPAQDKPRSGGELIFVVPSEPPSYDAHEEETFGVIHPMAPHYNTLLQGGSVRPDGHQAGGRSRRVVDDLEGRPDLHLQAPARASSFHDGSEMTSRGRQGLLRQDPLPARRREVDAQAELRFGARRSRRRIPTTVRFRLKWPESSFLLNLASPWNWIYKADILAKDMHWYEKNVMGHGPFTFVEHVQRLALGRARRTPTTGTRASPTSTATGRSSSAPRPPRWRRVRGERAHIQFRGFSPAERDSLGPGAWDRRSRCRRARGTA